MSDDKPRNPLFTLWNIVGTTGGIISLSSMVQNWFDDLVKWKRFIASIVESYRSIIEPVMMFLFGWLPWNIPFWVGDYLVLGVIMASSSYRGLKSLDFKDSSHLATIKTVWWFVGRDIFLWPMSLYEKYKEVRYSGAAEWDLRRAAAHELWWFGAIVLGLLILLAINSQL